MIAAAMMLTAGAEAAASELPLTQQNAWEEAAQPPASPAHTLVRLHIIAADNTPEAQRLKLEVRDAVLATAQRLLIECTSAQQAAAILRQHLDELSASAAARAALHGYTGPVRAEFGTFSFPDRTYGGVTVPAGDYPALRVIIGEGGGRNWWCVLYPSLCMSSDSGYDSIFAGWFRKWFGGEPNACVS